jgi:Zn-dependent protease with chaperone function
VIAPEDPEVIKKERAARRKRHVIRWGIFVYYAGLCGAIAIYLSFVYHLGTHVRPEIDLRPYQSYFQSVSAPKFPTLLEILKSNIELLIPFGVLVLILMVISWSPVRGLRPLPDYEAYAPLQVSRLKSSIEAVSLATGRPFLPCLVMIASMPNALAATIRGKPKLVVTSGLLHSDLTPGEMTAVAAHESVHVASGDALSWRGPSRLFLPLAALVSISIWWGVSVSDYLDSNFLNYNSGLFFFLFSLLLVAPIPIWIYFEVQLNRQDDLFADATAVMITRDPEALISAIEKIAAWEGTIDFSLFGIGALMPLGEEQGVLPRRASKHLFIDPLERDRGPKVDRKWRLSAHRLFGDRLLIVTRPSNKDRENLRAPRGERANLIHDRLTALRQIRDGDFSQVQLLKVPSDEWE